MDIVRCLHCGSFATAALLGRTDAELAPLYTPSGSSRLDYERWYLPARRATWNKVWPLFEDSAGSLLDVGCAYGDFLDAARAKGWRTAGVEIAEHHTDAPTTLNGHDIRIGTLDSLNLQDESFDAIFLWDVIEHLSVPADIIRICLRALKEAGWLIIRTPNAEVFSWCAASRNAVHKLYLELLYPSNVRQHIYHLTPTVLTRLVEKHGFNIVHVDKSTELKECPCAGRYWPITSAKKRLAKLVVRSQWPYEFTLAARKQSKAN
jgi:2-polyprenyl-3-methyl-5-hydroxy-6-metoxy-1,4-benzoquinol methylase